MTLDRVNNVTYLPVTDTSGEVSGDVQKPVAHAESAFDQTFESASLADSQDQRIGDVRDSLEGLVGEPSIMTDSSPAIREQIGSLETQLAESRIPVDAGIDSTMPKVLIELHPSVRFDLQSRQFQFNTSAGVTPDDSVWKNSEELDRIQINDAATTLTEDVISPDTLSSTMQAVRVPVPVEIVRQRADGEAIVVTSNGEFQLVRSGDNGQIDGLRVLEADGTILSASVYDADRSHRYREYYDDGTIGLEISYDSDNVVRQVNYFDARGTATTMEFYDRDGALTQSNQIEADGQTTRTEYF